MKTQNSSANGSLAGNLVAIQSPAKNILITGFIAGLLDASAGIIVYWLILGKMNIIQILQYIASGAFGPEAFQGGLLLAVAGLLLHYVIAYAFTAAYYFAYVRLQFIRQFNIVIGLVYGLAIWVVMNTVVLPLSNTPKSPFDLTTASLEIIWHIFLVGLPIAYFTAKGFAGTRK